MIRSVTYWQVDVGEGRPLKLGLILPEAEYDMGGSTARWSDLSAMARLAEDIGLDSVWFSDHLVYRDEMTTVDQQGVWECWSVTAALAVVTSRVVLGSLVTPTSFRNPALLAKMTDTVDEISGGRLILGLGAGYHKAEYDAFGYPHDHRALSEVSLHRLTTLRLHHCSIVRRARSGDPGAVSQLSSEQAGHGLLPARQSRCAPALCAVRRETLACRSDRTNRRAARTVSIGQRVLLVIEV